MGEIVGRDDVVELVLVLGLVFGGRKPSPSQATDVDEAELRLEEVATDEVTSAEIVGIEVDVEIELVVCMTSDAIESWDDNVDEAGATLTSLLP
jgi:hypothetical protein